MTSWDRLLESHPWPDHGSAEPGTVPFFQAGNQALLAHMFNTTLAVGPVVELGTYYGDSAEWMLTSQPDARLICIDTWLGSRMHHAPEPRKWHIRNAYEACAARLAPYRDRCRLLRCDTITGLWALMDHGIKPRFIYVDAGHEYSQVRADLETCLTLFPKTPLCGDDYSIGNDVDRALRACLIDFESDDTTGTWRMK